MQEPDAYSLEIAAEALRLVSQHVAKLPGWLGYLVGLQAKLDHVAAWLQSQADAKLAPEVSEEDLAQVRELLRASADAAAVIHAQVFSPPKQG